MADPEESLDQLAGVEGETADKKYSGWVLWLLPAILAANERLVFMASLMIGVGAVEDANSMIIYRFAGLVGGVFSAALKELGSVYSEMIKGRGERKEGKGAVQAAAVSAFAFLVGGMVPLLAAAFIKMNKVRVVVGTAVTLAMMVFGGVGAKLVGAPVGKSCLMLIVGVWVAMLLNFGLMKLFGSHEGK